MRKVRIVLLDCLTMQLSKLMRRYAAQERLLEDMIRPKILYGCGPKSSIG